MPLLIFLLFLCVPLLEIAVFIRVGSLIGLWPTLAIVVGTAVLGTYLLRQQGIQTIRTAQARMERGEAPIQEILHGVLIAVGGVLLLTPGLITDAAGLLLLIPPVRMAIGRHLGRWLKAHADVKVYDAQSGSWHETPPSDDNRPQSGSGTVTLEPGDYSVDEDTRSGQGPSGENDSDTPWRPPRQ